VLDGVDNCPTVANANQLNNDSDGVGNACDPDDDNDGICDSGTGAVALNTLGTRTGGIVANFTTMPWLQSLGTVTNGATYGCVPGVGAGGADNCPFAANATQGDWNNDGIGDACQDSDGDLVADSADNCIAVQNASQTDTDQDGRGNACDNCPADANPDQADWNNDGIGNVCQDFDSDSFMDVQEVWVGSKTTQRCAQPGETKADQSSTPYDINNDQHVDLSDILAFNAVFGTISPDPGFNKRYDENMDWEINLSDILRFNAVFGTSCTYP
jgi:hypothetical protein